MQNLIIASAVTVAMASIASMPVSLRSDPVLVRAVLDGDTIDVAAFGRVRLLGIDAPELGRGFDTSAPFGREARERLTQLVLHRWVRLEQEGADARRLQPAPRLRDAPRTACSSTPRSCATGSRASRPACR